jgi:hypothetical protein
MPVLRKQFRTEAPGGDRDRENQAEDRKVIPTPSGNVICGSAGQERGFANFAKS